MAKARRVKELSFVMPNRQGLLSEVTAALSSAKVNITSICAFEMDNSACFMLTTDSAAKARRAISALGAEIESEDVVAVEMPNRVGELRKVAERIAAAGINVYYMYGTTGTGGRSTCLFKTSDDRKAIRVINK